MQPRQLLAQGSDDAPVVATGLKTNAQPGAIKTAERSAIPQQNSVTRLQGFPQRDKRMLPMHQQKIRR